MQRAYIEIRLVYVKRERERQTRPTERAGQDEIRAVRYPQSGSRQVRQLERACRQPEAAWCGSAFQTQGTDQRGTGCRIHQERLPFQRLQGGQVFQLFQD